LAYCQRAREAYKGVPIVAGGVEASLRRIAHYDYWSDKVRRSIVMDAKPDLLVFGMGERTLLEIVRRLDGGESVDSLHDLRGVAYRLGAKEAAGLSRSAADEGATAGLSSSAGHGNHPSAGADEKAPSWQDTILLPSYEEVFRDKRAFSEMTRIAHLETNPYNARRLVQFHGSEAVVVNPPAMPLEPDEIDRVYDQPFTRRPHPSYGEQKIPALEVVRDSIQIMRGCFGGCAFCSITAHEGRIVQSRGRESILAEIRRMAGDRDFTGTISNLGGPTANMYRMNCSRPEVRRKCRRLSCLHPRVCKLLATDHGPLIELMKAARHEPGVKQVLVASGVRMDLALRSKAYIGHLARHHVGGHLKVAPEHTDAAVLQLMKKPTVAAFEAFVRRFAEASRGAGKRQYLLPYFIAGHPGSDLRAMIDVALYLKRTGYRVEQVQDFLPGPFDVATCMYHTGIDPMTGRSVYVPRGMRERRMQKALLQYAKPENYRLVREALLQAGRSDLVGDGPECLIPTHPPAGARGEKEPRAQRPAAAKSPRPSGTGYRPHRKTAKRRGRN
jgi:uncharacterized radical SAM protein YgiQ